MITTRLYLDTRYTKPGNPAPLKYVINKNKVRALVSLNIRIDSKNWDASKQKASGEYANLNALLTQKKAYVDTLIFQMEANGELDGLKSCEIKKKVKNKLFGEEEKKEATILPNNFKARFESFSNSRPSDGTKILYKRTWIQIEKFAKEEKINLSSLTFEQIDIKWLKDFETFLSKTSPSKNARNIHFRNIRAVFNDAIDEEIISCYPFRRFKIRAEKTRKRSIEINRLREIMNSEPAEEWKKRYSDCFKLIFLLCGINIVDLFNLDMIEDGRINYTRAKTHRLYSIKVEPEALEIINKWKGKKKLLCYADTSSKYRTFYGRLSGYLQTMNLSTYYARHSWATVAASLDIPKETIAAALGHGGNSVTDIYIDFDQRKVDEANRKVIDWVLYGKV